MLTLPCTFWSRKWRRMWSFAVHACALFLLATLVPRIARADEPGVASSVGRQASGLPGVGQVAFASESPRTFVASGTGGFAITEAQANEVGGHQRVFGGLAAAVQPLRFLAAALAFDGRFDTHPGGDSTGNGEPRGIVRAASAVTRSVALGGQLDVMVPGGEFPSFKPEASRVDLRALATFAPPGTELALAFNVGYRRDGTARILNAQERAFIHAADKLTLGVSDFDAVLLGLGVSKRIGSFGGEVIGEAGWDILLGSNAPKAIESPLRVGAGFREHVNPNLSIELLIDVLLGERPSPAVFAPIEPRLALTAGLRWVLPFDKPPPATDTTKPPVDTTTKPAADLDRGTVAGHVKSETGEPIANAHVTAGEERAADTAADGAFEIKNVKAGRVHVAAKAAGFDDIAIDVDLEATKTASAELVMKKTIKPGQLRGLVRSYSGKPLAATIRVEPIGTEVKTDADGTFTIDVPPGAYEVSVSAPGHAPQKRPVQVEENGVTVLNADLRPGGGSP